MSGRIWAIALNTFREAARIRVVYGIIGVVFVANMFALACGHLSIHEEARVARDIGLAGISFFGGVTAIILGVFLLYTEVQRRTIHAIVSKPIDRWEFVVGKYVGMALLLSVLVALFGGAMMVMLVLQGSGISENVIKALILSWCEVLTIAAIAIFFSSFSSPFLSALFAAAMWLIGRLTPDIENAARSSTAAIQWTTKVALEITPDLHLFSISGQTVDGNHVSVNADFVSWAYVTTAGLHGLGWVVGLLAFAALLFHRRDFV